MHMNSLGAITLVLACAAGSTFADDDELVRKGEAVYMDTCVLCHGEDGTGSIPGAADLSARPGALSKSDDELAKSIVEGVADAPIPMPPNGGNPALTEDDVRAVIAYLRATFGRP